MIEARVADRFSSQHSVSVKNAVAPSTLRLLVAAVLASAPPWHRPGDEQKTFVITPQGSSVCVSLINGDEDAQHRAASAALYLGSTKLCESCVEHVTTLTEKAVAVDSGVLDSGVPQALRVLVRGDGHDDFVDVVVREGGALERMGLVRSRKGQAEIEAFNEHVPEAVSPFASPVELRAEATLLRLVDGLQGGNLSLRWQWELQQAGTCGGFASPHAGSHQFYPRANHGV